MRIFVAGPWGDYAGVAPEIVERNIQIADSVGQDLVHMGHEAYIPHTMCKSWSGKFDLEDMIRLDMSFLNHWAQAIVRIPGHSHGADAEVERAKELGLVVFAVTPGIMMLQLDEEPT